MKNFNPQPKQKTKKVNRKTVVKKLDTIVSQYIRLRDKQCVICGSKESLTNGHIFTRTNYSTRWDTTKDGNCHCQCMGCNLRHEYDSYPFYTWYMNKFSKKKFDKLHERFNQTTNLKTCELQELYEEKNKLYLKLNQFKNVS